MDKISQLVQAGGDEHNQPGLISTQSSSGHTKLTSPITQKGFNDATQKLKPKRRKKAEIIEVHGGRIIRSSGRKDRHSKVCTARGTRDRRVRLSPKTAIQFYDVQDRLGYDRPSKAIDWLMNEAKSAIDALNADQPPLITSTNGLPGNIDPVSSFDFLTNSADFQAYSNDDTTLNYPKCYQDGFSSALLTTHSEMFDANLEMAKMQRIFDYTSVGNLPIGFPGPMSVLGHGEIMYTQREPLQSSYSRINPISSRFSGIDFSNEELPNFTTMEEDEMDKNHKPSSSASFLNYGE